MGNWGRWDRWQGKLEPDEPESESSFCHLTSSVTLETNWTTFLRPFFPHPYKGDSISQGRDEGSRRMYERFGHMARHAASAHGRASERRGFEVLKRLSTPAFPPSFPAPPLSPPRQQRPAQAALSPSKVWLDRSRNEKRSNLPWRL